MSLDLYWPRCEDPNLLPEPDFGVELVSGDFSDAYFHFRVHEAEWRHTAECMQRRRCQGAALATQAHSGGLRTAF